MDIQEIFDELSPSEKNLFIYDNLEYLSTSDIISKVDLNELYNELSYERRRKFIDEHIDDGTYDEIFKYLSETDKFNYDFDVQYLNGLSDNCKRDIIKELLEYKTDYSTEIYNYIEYHLNNDEKYFDTICDLLLDFIRKNDFKILKDIDKDDIEIIQKYLNNCIIKNSLE